ncbi:ABC transporter permease [Paenibacillus glufosinatiresistens]|uniref:ABC transporter permease n=1 Tax=Paenibacillus glufosinatiresistens TaxID=3070657 RepID=UPI00286D73E4|nr:ABC transporter permease [Paenibacillus sp. YX.27]
MDLRELRGRRRRQAMGGIMPYVGYIIQSGVAMVFAFGLIAFAAWYTALLQDVPEGLPILPIMLAILAPAAVHSSFRTYLQEPDAIFLLPQGHRMKAYFAPAWVSGTVWKSLRLLLLLLLLWPLYIRSAAEPKALAATLLLLLGVKVLSSFGCWRELNLISPAAAAGYRLLRWAVGLLIAAAWLWQPALRGLLFSGLLAAAYLAALAVPARHRVAWDRLIATEKAQAERALLLLGWFVDVPGRGQKVYRRRWLSRWGAGLPWKKETAYRFLLTKTLARGETLGMVTRIGVLTLLLVYWTRGGWGAPVLYLFFLFVIGVQLSGVAKPHEESFWLTVYPLPEGSRRRSTVSLVFGQHLIWAVLLWLPLLANGADGLGASLLTLAGGAAVAGLTRYRLDRRLRQPNEEDL